MKLTLIMLVLFHLLPAAHATLNRDGLPGISKTYSGQSLQHGKLGVGIYTHVISDEQILQDGVISVNGENREVPYFLTANTQTFLSLGLGNHLDLAFSLPFYYENLKVDGDSKIKHQHTGDLKLRAKFHVPFSEEQQVAALALLLGGTSPIQKNKGIIPREIEFVTNDAFKFDEGSSPFGVNQPTAVGALILSLDLSQVQSQLPVMLHLNLGGRKVGFKDKPRFQDVLFWSTALEFQAHQYLKLFTEFHHESRFNLLSTSQEWATEPTTLSFGGVLQAPFGLDFHAGMVMGLFNKDHSSAEFMSEYGGSVHAFGIKGAPQASMYAQLNWSGFLISQDNDKDGIKNTMDKCPNEPEDKDGFEDEDGCPDNDNDKDGIPDVKDKCPNEAEDMDGFEDEDGCPDTDNDKDGVPDSKDKCPLDPQGPDGTEGCPNNDKDKDGILDADDKCPNDPEDKDGFEDGDGCPDLDNDKDGIPDALDKCPNAPETVNNFQDDDGCPDAVQIQPGKTLILKGINFKTGSAELTPESFAVLDDVVPGLKEIADAQIEIQGHTDAVGNDASNRRLSQARAQSVANYFIDQGVPANRITAKGYGESKPLAPNNTAEGRAMNRRVELKRIK